MYGNFQNPNMIPFFPMNNFNNFNNFLPTNNVVGGQLLSLIYNNGNFNNNNQQQNFNLGKINVIFKTTGGLITNLSVNPDKPLCDVLLLYLKRVGKPELFEENSGIFFLYNANRIKLNDNTPIKNFLNIIITPTIMVNDVKNLIGA